MNLFLNNVVFDSLKSRVDFKRERNSCVVKFFRANIYRTRALANLDPVFTKTRIGENVNVSGFGILSKVLFNL